MLKSEQVQEKEESLNKNVFDAINKEEEAAKGVIVQPILEIENLLPKPICSMAKTMYKDFINVDTDSSDEEEDENEKSEKKNKDSDEEDSDTDSDESDTFQHELETDLSFSVGNEIFSCNFHPYQDQIAFGTINGKIHIYEYNYGGRDNKPIHCFVGTTGKSVKEEEQKESNPNLNSIKDLCFSDDGTELFYADGSNLRSFDNAKLSNRWELLNCHQSSVNKFLPATDTVIVTGDDEGFVKVWDVRVPKEENSAVYVLDMKQKNYNMPNYPLIARKRKRGEKIQPQPQKPAQKINNLSTFEEHADYITDFDYNVDSKALYATSGDGSMSIYDLRYFENQRTHKKHFGNVVDLTPTGAARDFLSVKEFGRGRFIACGTDTGQISIFRIGEYDKPFQNVPVIIGNQQVQKMKLNTIRRQKKGNKKAGKDSKTKTEFGSIDALLFLKEDLLAAGSALTGKIAVLKTRKLIAEEGYEDDDDMPEPSDDEEQDDNASDDDDEDDEEMEKKFAAEDSSDDEKVEKKDQKVGKKEEKEEKKETSDDDDEDEDDEDEDEEDDDEDEDNQKYDGRKQRKRRKKEEGYEEPDSYFQSINKQFSNAQLKKFKRTDRFFCDIDLVGIHGTSDSNYLVDRSVSSEALGIGLGSVNQLALSRDGKTIASCGNDCFVRFWDVSALFHTKIAKPAEEAVPIQKEEKKEEKPNSAPKPKPKPPVKAFNNSRKNFFKGLFGK